MPFRNTGRSDRNAACCLQNREMAAVAAGAAMIVGSAVMMGVQFQRAFGLEDRKARKHQ